MIASTTEIEHRLRDLDPNSDDFAYLVDELVAEISPAIAATAYEPILRFFAEHPDCGGLTALAHHVENFYPNYTVLLRETFRQSPSWNGVMLINRILNSNISEKERSEHLDILRLVAFSSEADQTVAEMAEGYLARHTAKDDSPM